MYKNIDLDKIISTIIGEKFVEFTLLDERFFIPIDGLNRLVFEKNRPKEKNRYGQKYQHSYGVRKNMFRKSDTFHFNCDKSRKIGRIT